MATSARTMRHGKLGKYNLRLVRKDGHFYGLVDGKKCVDGTDAEDVWRRLRRDAGKADPKYFGYAGPEPVPEVLPQRPPLRRFASEERDYTLAASRKLDATAPLAEALNGCGLGRRFFQPSKRRTCSPGSRLPESPTCCTVVTPMHSFVRRPGRHLSDQCRCGEDTTLHRFQRPERMVCHAFDLEMERCHAFDEMRCHEIVRVCTDLGAMRIRLVETLADHTHGLQECRHAQIEKGNGHDPRVPVRQSPRKSWRQRLPN